MRRVTGKKQRGDASFHDEEINGECAEKAALEVQ